MTAQETKSTVMTSVVAKDGTAITVSLISPQPLHRFTREQLSEVAATADHLRDILDDVKPGL